jgi:hypothetical protein
MGHTAARSSGSGASAQVLERLGAELAQGGTADQLGLEAEDVVDGGVRKQKSLSLDLAFELLHLPLSSSDGQVRVFRPVVGPHAAGPMAIGEAEFAGGQTVRGKLVSDDRFGVDALVAQQFPEELQGSRLVAALLDQHVQNLAFIVDGAPELHAPAADLYHDLNQMSARGGRRSAAAQGRRDGKSELVGPAASISH